MDLILYDSEQELYLMKPNSGKQPGTTKDKNVAWQIPEQEIDYAWQMAHKAAWLGIGIFFVHGI